MKTGRAFLVALAAAIGNGLQGWDNSAMAGSLLFLVSEFHLSASAVGMVVAASLFGAVFSTTIAGPASDAFGRKAVLLASAVVFFTGELLGGWSPDVLVLTIGRGLAGFGIGLVSTIAPLYISECSPASVRGQLATLPQLLGVGAMIMSYAVVLFLSFTSTPNWRMMLGLGCVPSSLYVILTIFVLPETPPWLVNKGRVQEAKKVLELLQGSTDVSGELALLIDGLGGPQPVSIEEWILRPVQEDSAQEDSLEKVPTDHVLVAPQEGLQLIGEPVDLGLLFCSEVPHSLPESTTRSSATEVVALMDEVQNLQSSLSIRGSELVANSSMSTRCYSARQDDVEAPIFGDMDDLNLTKPLLDKFETASNHQVEVSQHFLQQGSGTSHTTGSILPAASSQFPQDLSEDFTDSNWHLAWQVDSEAGASEAGSFNLRRVIMLPRMDSTLNHSMNTSSKISEQEPFPALVLVSQSTGGPLKIEGADGPAMLHPAELAKSPSPLLPLLLEKGVLRALIAGAGLQALQQACGVNAVMYYTPTILMDSGASFLTQFGFSTESSSIFASLVATTIMLPFIFITMRLMDTRGRRALLLNTVPLMVLSMAVLCLAITFLHKTALLSVLSLVGLVVFSCSFIMGLGPVPNIFCAEIFPTKVRGICLGICAATMWAVNILVSQAFPLLRESFGLGGVFGVFGFMSILAWIFVYKKIPETKGLPLEVICDIFATTETNKP